MSQTKRHIRRCFNQAAHSYDQAATAQANILQHLLQGPLPDDAQTILELGCGTGNSLDHLRQRYPHAQIIACDLAEQMLQQGKCQYTHPAITWLCADMEHLPLADQCVDLIVSSLAIQWSQSTQQLVAECQRILKPKGHFCFATLAPDTLTELRAASSRTFAYPDLAQWYTLLTAHQFKTLALTPHTQREHFPSAKAALNHLKAIGAQYHPQRPAHISQKKSLQTLLTRYAAYRLPDARYPLTYQAIVGYAQKAE